MSTYPSHCSIILWQPNYSYHCKSHFNCHLPGKPALAASIFHPPFVPQKTSGDKWHKILCALCAGCPSCQWHWWYQSKTSNNVISHSKLSVISYCMQDMHQAMKTGPVERIAHLNNNQNRQSHRHWLCMKEYWAVNSSKQLVVCWTLHVMCLQSIIQHAVSMQQMSHTPPTTNSVQTAGS